MAARDPVLAALGDAERRLCEAAGDLAAERGERAYLVGGVVRDLLLGRESDDLDIVVVGDGLAVAQGLSRSLDGALTRYHAFGTARVDLPDGDRIDVATARSETYRRPGELPRVSPGSLEADLQRRDFTINTMAVGLTGEERDRLFDPFDGRADLQRGVVRILHEQSFADDPTRLLRAVRFALRFEYRLEDTTARGFAAAVQGHYLDTVSGARIRRELRKTFTEAPVEGALRLDADGLLAQVDEELEASRELLARLDEERRGLERLTGAPWPGAWIGVVAACFPRPAPQARHRLAERLRLPRGDRERLVHAGLRWEQAREELLAEAPDADLRPSRVARVLADLDPVAVLYGVAVLEARGAARAAASVRRYLHEDRTVQPRLSGEDLLAMGCPSGRRVGRILGRLRDAVLDGEVVDEAGERDLVRRLLERI